MGNACNQTRKSTRKENPQESIEEIREIKILDMWSRRNSMATHSIPTIDDSMVIPTIPR